MRTLALVGTILVLLSGGSLIYHDYIHSSTQALLIPLDEVEHSILPQKWETAQEGMHTALKRWDDDKFWWTILLDHQEIDNIDISMMRLEKYLETQNITLSLGEVSALKLLIDHIVDSYELKISNIL